jgi:hypothetical protein
VPSCYSKEEKVALVECRGGLPAFLPELTADPLGESQIITTQTPEDHLVANVNLAHAKLCAYYAKSDNAPVYYAATVLHLHYKHHLEAL